MIVCPSCGQEYGRVGRIPVLLPHPDAHVDLWRRQLAFVKGQSEHSLRVLDEQASAPGLPASAEARLRTLAQSVRDQAHEIFGVLGPALGGSLPTGEINLPRGADTPINDLHFLYRDWGWESAGDRENEAALDAVRKVIDPVALERTLVLGSGASRLAYDVHRLCGATETVVVDIDPFVFVIAEAVVRGASVKVTESTANVNEARRAALSWTLKAPAGPLDEASFLFLFANGLAPPFLAGTFDTVVTPWFIDQVPTDLPAFFDTIRRLLRPKGRWINHGPLIYKAEAPLWRRLTRDEIFDLAGRVGFRIERWSSESRPYLVSPLNGRGKVEWVLTFEAVRQD